MAWYHSWRKADILSMSCRLLDIERIFCSDSGSYLAGCSEAFCVSPDVPLLKLLWCAKISFVKPYALCSLCKSISTTSEQLPLSLRTPSACCGIPFLVCWTPSNCCFVLASHSSDSVCNARLSVLCIATRKTSFVWWSVATNLQNEPCCQLHQ